MSTDISIHGDSNDTNLVLTSPSGQITDGGDQAAVSAADSATVLANQAAISAQEATAATLQARIETNEATILANAAVAASASAVAANTAAINQAVANVEVTIAANTAATAAVSAVVDANTAATAAVSAVVDANNLNLLNQIEEAVNELEISRRAAGQGTPYAAKFENFAQVWASQSSEIPGVVFEPSAPYFSGDASALYHLVQLNVADSNKFINNRISVSYASLEVVGFRNMLDVPISVQQTSEKPTFVRLQNGDVYSPHSGNPNLLGTAECLSGVLTLTNGANKTGGFIDQGQLFSPGQEAKDFELSFDVYIGDAESTGEVHAHSEGFSVTLGENLSATRETVEGAVYNAEYGMLCSTGLVLSVDFVEIAGNLEPKIALYYDSYFMTLEESQLAVVEFNSLTNKKGENVTLRTHNRFERLTLSYVNNNLEVVYKGIKVIDHACDYIDLTNAQIGIMGRTTASECTMKIKNLVLTPLLTAPDKGVNPGPPAALLVPPSYKLADVSGALRGMVRYATQLSSVQPNANAHGNSLSAALKQQLGKATGKNGDLLVNEVALIKDGARLNQEDYSSPVLTTPSFEAMMATAVSANNASNQPFYYAPGVAQLMHNYNIVTAGNTVGFSDEPEELFKDLYVDDTSNVRTNGLTIRYDMIVHIPYIGKYTFISNTDDGHASSFPWNFGEALEYFTSFDGGRGYRTDQNTVLFTQPGYYPMSTLYWDGGGGAGIEISCTYTRKGVRHTHLLNADHEDSIKTYYLPEMMGAILDAQGMTPTMYALPNRPYVMSQNPEGIKKGLKNGDLEIEMSEDVSFVSCTLREVKNLLVTDQTSGELISECVITGSSLKLNSDKYNSLFPEDSVLKVIISYTYNSSVVNVSGSTELVPTSRIFSYKFQMESSYYTGNLNPQRHDLDSSNRGFSYDMYAGGGGSGLDKMYNDPKYPHEPYAPTNLKDAAGDIMAAHGVVSCIDMPAGNPGHGPKILRPYGNWADQYSFHMTALVSPPTSGKYVFITSSDDQSQLHLSTDADPKNSKLLCEESSWNAVMRGFFTGDAGAGNFAEIVSDPVDLSAGQQYFLEYVGREGGGGDHFACTWGKVEGTERCNSVLVNHLPIDSRFAVPFKDYDHNRPEEPALPDVAHVYADTIGAKGDFIRLKWNEGTDSDVNSSITGHIKLPELIDLSLEEQWVGFTLDLVGNTAWDLSGAFSGWNKQAVGGMDDTYNGISLKPSMVYMNSTPLTVLNPSGVQVSPTYKVRQWSEAAVFTFDKLVVEMNTMGTFYGARMGLHIDSSVNMTEPPQPWAADMVEGLRYQIQGIVENDMPFWLSGMLGNNGAQGGGMLSHNALTPSAEFYENPGPLQAAVIAAEEAAAAAAAAAALAALAAAAQAAADQLTAQAVVEEARMVAGPVITVGDLTLSAADMIFSAPERAPTLLDGHLGDWAALTFKSQIPFENNGELVLFEGYAGGTWSGPADATSEVAFSWDADNLFIGVRQFDDSHQNNSSAWNGDSVQIVFANAEQDTVIGLLNIGLDNNKEDVIVHNEMKPGSSADLTAQEHVKIVRHDTHSVTSYEVKVPRTWLAFDSAFAAGMAIGVGICVNDGEAEEGQAGQKGWSGWGPYSAVYGKTASATGLVNLVPAPSSS